MPPCSSQLDGKSSVMEAKKPLVSLQLNDLRKCIPQEAFQKSIFKSMWFLLFDYAMWFGITYAMTQLCASPFWALMPSWQQAIATFFFWNIAGFFMWGIFVVGHDCGHGTFSDFEMVNDILGHICHGSILVPYYPWQLSHRRHHMYHNHSEKDYSYPWYTPEKLAHKDESLARMLHNQPALIFFFPYFGWPIYLYGFPDGCHLFPFANTRLWKDTATNEYVKCIISSAVIVANLAAIYYICGQSFANMAFYYLPPWVFFGWWLVTVTYLQHHDPDTVVYDDKDWKFVDSAFETVDRVFGFGIDYFHHHITDGHVAHHLFFTKIPHYNLPIATKAIREYLEDKDCSHMYKRDQAYDFVYRVHKYLVTNGLKTHMASEVDKKMQ